MYRKSFLFQLLTLEGISCTDSYWRSGCRGSTGNSACAHIATPFQAQILAHFQYSYTWWRLHQPQMGIRNAPTDQLSCTSAVSLLQSVPMCVRAWVNQRPRSDRQDQQIMHLNGEAAKKSAGIAVTTHTTEQSMQYLFPPHPFPFHSVVFECTPLQPL